MAITINPLSDALGAEIRGVDLSKPLDDETISVIHQAWLDNLVIVVRDQNISANDQMRFCGYFGEVGARARPAASRSEAKVGDAPAEVMYVSNRRVNGNYIGSLPEGEMQFHIDQCYTREPAAATVLYAVEIPAQGGDTLFGNLYSAYDALDVLLREKLKDHRAIHVYQYGETQRNAQTTLEKMPHFAHPIFRAHPETGRHALWINRLMTQAIEGLSHNESQRLLSDLFEIQERPAYIYRHVWKVGDLLMWDNRCVIHARTDFDPSQPRHLVRFTLKGDQPFT